MTALTDTAAQPLPISPGATLDVVWDWSAWLAPGDTITSTAVTASAGVSVADAAPPPVGASVTAWITLAADLAAGRWLDVTCRITTASNPQRIDSRVYRLVVTQR